jgi:hypothetical protein
LIGRLLPWSNIDHEATFSGEVKPANKVIELMLVVLGQSERSHFAHPVQKNIDEDSRAKDVRRVIHDSLPQLSRSLQSSVSTGPDQVVGK